MSQGVGPSWPTHSVSLPLSGGRAPLCWQRLVARSAARLDFQRRSCAWVEALAKIRPKLRDGPLLGNCLTTLTTEAAHLAQREPEVARPPQAIANRLVESAARERQSASDADRPTRWPGVSPPTGWRTVPPRSPHLSDERGARQAIADLAGLPQQASHRLLRRLIGAEEPSLGVGPSNHSPTLSASKIERRSSPGPPRAKPSRDGLLLRPEHFVKQRSVQISEDRQRAKLKPVSEGHKPAVRRAWREDLVRRARHRLRRAGLPPPVQVERDEAVLAEQWSAPIAGPTAPPHLLIQMDGLSQHGGFGSSSGEHHHMASRPAPDHYVPESASNASGLADRIAPPTTDTSVAMTPAIASRMGVEAEPLARTRIAPRAVTVMLPPLVSPKVVGMPAPSVAAASVLKGAQVEVDATEDDLSVLAAKIRRILEEEARRHGIDV
jgi:hypothetical protein